MTCTKTHEPIDYADFERMTENIRPWPDLEAGQQ